MIKKVAGLVFCLLPILILLFAMVGTSKAENAYPGIQNCAIPTLSAYPGIIDSEYICPEVGIIGEAVSLESMQTTMNSGNIPQQEADTKEQISSTILPFFTRLFNAKANPVSTSVPGFKVVFPCHGHLPCSY